MSTILVQPNKLCGSLHTDREYQDQEPEPEEKGFRLGLDKLIDFRWTVKFKENPELFEKDCIHGKNCKQINKCGCTPLSICSSNDKKRAEETKSWRSNLHHNVRRRKGYQEQTNHNHNQSNTNSDNRKSSCNDFEDFAEEYFRQ